MSRKKKKYKNGKNIFKDFFVFLLGSVAVLGGVLILWMSEYQTVRFRHLSARALNEAVEMSDISKLDPALDGKLVHACGEPKCQDELEDPLFGVRVKALTYNRKAEYYQLTESKHTTTGDDGRSEEYYSYYSLWTNSPVSSGAFHDDYYKYQAKPPITTVDDLKLQTKNASFGAYRLPSSLLDSYEGSEPVSFDFNEEKKNRIAQKLNISVNLLHKTGAGIYIGMDPGEPSLGDVRITFSCAPVSEISIIAAVKGDSLVRFRDSSDPDDVYLSKIVNGRVSLDEMIDKINKEEAVFDWIMRCLSLVITLLGSAFMPWQKLMGFAPVRLLLNGSAADSKNNRDWSILSVVRITLALLLLTAGLTWLLSGETVIGGALLAISAALYILPFTERHRGESPPENQEKPRKRPPTDSGERHDSEERYGSGERYDSEERYGSEEQYYSEEQYDSEEQYYSEEQYENTDWPENSRY